MKRFYALIIISLILSFTDASAEEYWQFFPATQVDGIIAVSTDGAVYCVSPVQNTIDEFDGTGWSNMPFTGESLREGAVVVYCAPDSSIWVDGYSGETFRIKNGVCSKYLFDGETVTAFAAAPNSDMWMRTDGVAGGNIWRFTGESWEPVPHSIPGVLPSYSPIAVDGDGVVWTSHMAEGIYKFDGQEWTDYSDPSLLFVTSIAIDNQNIPFFLSRNLAPSARGLFRFDGISWETIPLPEGFSINDIDWYASMAFASDGSLWIGTGSKLVKYKDGAWNVYILPQNLSIYTICGVTSAGVVGKINDSSQNEGFRFSDTTPLAVAGEEAPDVFQVMPPYPNPFNPSTTIGFTLPETMTVTLSIYSITGQKITTLVDESLAAGTHRVVFDGSGLASGVYFYRFDSPGFRDVGRMLLVK